MPHTDFLSITPPKATYRSSDAIALLALAAIGVTACASDDATAAIGGDTGSTSTAGSDTNDDESATDDTTTDGGGDTSDDSSGEPPDGEPSFASRGPKTVGYRTVAATPDRPELGIWYPAHNEDGTSESIVYEFMFKVPDFGVEPVTVSGRALQDAPADKDGPYPLVVFSHGFATNAPWYSGMLEHFASHGFVVIAPEHIEQDWLENSAAIVQRPIDISATIDYAEQLERGDDALSGLVDTSEVAVVGHSFGGYTALASAGALIEMNVLNARCAEIRREDPKSFLCAPLAGREAELAGLAGLDEVPRGNWPSFGDTRVTAVVPIAGDAYMFDPTGLAAISVPLMAMGGTADTGTPYDWGPQMAFTDASSPDKMLVGFEGAEHFFMSNSCQDMPWTDGFLFEALLCQDPAWDKQQARDLTHHFATAFLLDVLVDDRAAAAALLPSAAMFDGIEYTTGQR